MSDNIPFEIQVEILKWLPVRSLIQFRSVSKTWRSLIDSSDFIASHDVRHAQTQHLVVTYTYNHRLKTGKSYVSFVDDDTFPQQKSDLLLPMAVKLLRHTSIVGSSHGLLCFDGYLDAPAKTLGGVVKFVVLWNPSIRKSILIGVPHLYKAGVDAQICLGFGVCPVTREPKIVMIRRLSMWWEKVETTWEIKVYALNSRKWRSLSSNLIRDSISDIYCPVVIERYNYWLAYDRHDTGAHARPLILSFDMTDEVFRVVDLPDSMPKRSLSISKLRESLVVLDYCDENGICDVWMMEHDDSVQARFTKLLTFETPQASIRTKGFRENGEVLMEIEDVDNYDEPCLRWSAFVSYEPNSKHINDLGLYAKFQYFKVNSYVETLLLLDHSGCYSY